MLPPSGVRPAEPAVVRDVHEDLGAAHAAVEGDAPANLRLRRQQAQRGEAGDAFAAATFADEAERFAWPDVEVDAVYHADHAAAARCEIDRDLP